MNRSLYLTEQFKQELDLTRYLDIDIRRFAELEADLELFVTEPELRNDYIWLLYPPEKGVWDLRSKCNPQIRVFGMFMWKDIFVITHHECRDRLGEFGSREWKREIARCRTRIRNLFQPDEPLIDSNVNNVFSGAIDEQYCKD